MAIKLGTDVQQIVTPIAGKVVQRRFHDQADQMEYLVEWPDDDSDDDLAPQQRWFLESEIQEVAS
jgi:hypothetical protein